MSISEVFAVTVFALLGAALGIALLVHAVRVHRLARGLTETRKVADLGFLCLAGLSFLSAILAVAIPLYLQARAGL